MNPRLVLSLALAGTFLTTHQALAQGECFPTCRTGYVCSPANECVSICNPPCGDGEICTAEATCMVSPAPAPQQQPQQPQQWEQAPPQQPQWQPAPQPQWQEQAPAAPGPVVPSTLARPGSFRLHVGGHLGVAGGAAAYVRGDEVSSVDLDPTFGAQVQGLIPISDFVLVGPAVSFRSMRGDGARDRDNFLGAGLAFGAHYAIDLGGMALDPYLLFSLGLAVAFAQDSSADAELGIDFALRAGANLWFSDVVGMSFSLGYQRADFYPDIGFGSTKGHAVFHQLAIELGLALRFGE